jgi:beta-carotene 3-hydroxylase
MNTNQILINIGIVLITFILTEFSAWFNHKYIMHGFLWYLHADHHKKDHDSWFERNDWFFLMYAIPSFFCILFGELDNYAWYTFVGFGIMLYGFAYFIVHDVIIHQRFKWFTRSNNVYVLALRRAHKMHHKHIGKNDGESFGMLLVKPKYFIEAAKLRQKP